MTATVDWPTGNLVDEIAALLRERILDGRAAAGAALSQRRLADELGVSTRVVGDAVRALRSDGLIAIAPTPEGMEVLPDDDLAILLSAYELREMIDGLAARLAASNVGPALEPVLRASIDEQRCAVEMDDCGRYERANRRFHGGLIGAAGNQFLPFHLALIRSTLRSAALIIPARFAEATEEHETILRAVCQRDSDQAESCARAHVRATAAALARMDEQASRH